MAKRQKKQAEEEGEASWIVTFADLITLLLTFFVLLLSMSTMTISSFSEIESFLQPRNFISHSDSGNIPQRIQLVVKELLDPDIEPRIDRVKDLLFPYEAIPKEMKKDKLMDNLDILLRSDGLVIVMTDSILFEHGEVKLSETNKKLLAPLYNVLLYTNQDINISAHTDDMPTRGLSSYTISSLRALSVLDFFLNEVNINDALTENRMSISAYGPDRPIADNATPEGRAKNRRIEILLKTPQGVGGYN